MKMLTYKPEIRTEKSFPGLLSCVFKHEIKSASASLDYQGPVIGPEVWNRVLAFFKWTHDTTQSESQVRLFVNPTQGRWEAWAFPQEARTGMTSKELDTPNMKTQRAAFGDDQGWVYFSTVHHHCNMSAFQSGTDQANEIGIDGIHLTIGNLDSPRYDIHARFYLGGCGFDPDLSLFWDIGEELKALIPRNLWDAVARHQLCNPAPPSTEFPAQWKQNLIEVKRTFPEYTPTTSIGFAKMGRGHGSWRSDSLPVWMRARDAIGELATELLKNPNSLQEQEGLAEWIENLHSGLPNETHESVLLNIMQKYDVHIEDLSAEIPHDGNLSACLFSYKHSPADPRPNHYPPLLKIGEEKSAVDTGQLWDGHMGMME
jgi:hypothetical protein